MTLLSYTELVKLVDDGVIDAKYENINGSSIDITLDDIVMIEDTNFDFNKVIDLAVKDNINLVEHNIGVVGGSGVCDLEPDEFILASSREIFNLPNNISAEYKLKSSMARNGLEHLNAGWCDAGWNGSKLTLELKNMTQYHTLRLRPKMKIGQVVFFKHEPVPEDASYATKGQYNGQKKVQESKGIL